MADNTESQSLSGTVIAGSEEDFDVVCDFCSLQGKRKEAVASCKTCREHLCIECRQIHTKTSATFNHILQDNLTLSSKGGKPRQRPVDPAELLLDRCHKHPDEVIKFYCDNHKQLACSVCVSPLDPSHRACDKKVFYIRDISRGEEVNTELNNTLEELMSLVSALETSQDQSTKFQKLTESSFKQIESEIKQLREAINKQIDKLEQKLLNEAKQLKQEALDSLKVPVTANDMIMQIKQVHADLDSKQQQNLFNQLFVSLKKAQEQIQSFKSFVNVISSSVKPIQLTFQPNIEAVSMTTAESLGNVSLLTRTVSQGDPQAKPETVRAVPQGDVQTKPKTERVVPQGDVQTKPKTVRAVPQGDVQTKPKTERAVPQGDVQTKPKTERAVPQDDVQTEPKTVRAVRQADLKVKSDKDKSDCLITGLTGLADGRLAVVDHTNSCVKVIEPAAGRVTERVEVTPPPRDITAVDDNQLAVTLPGTRRLQLLRLSPALSLHRTLDVPGNYWGLTYRGGNYFLASRSPPAVHICDPAGQLIQQIGNTGQELFSPYYITVSPDTQSVWVSDWDKGHLVCVTRSGAVRGTYGGARGPRGVVTDGGGQTYLCCYWDNTVHQVGAGGRGRVLLEEKDRVWRPQAITLQGRQLFVSSCSGVPKYDNSLRVFSLQ